MPKFDLDWLTVKQFKKRFNSYGWDYIDINGHNEKQIFNALKKAQKSKLPTAISCKTIIGYGSPNKSGKASAHGSPLGKDEIKLVREKLEWNHEPFKIPKKIMDTWRQIGKRGAKIENHWDKKNRKKKFKIKELFENRFINTLKKEKKDAIKNNKNLATRKSSELALNALTKKIKF